jgi:hypothetical protein
LRYFSILILEPRINGKLQPPQGMIAISLNAWTSPNRYAFIAIVAHYITNDGKLGKCLYLPALWRSICDLLPAASEELLIDFQQSIGDHSGESMAELVCNTLQNYGLTGRVRLNTSLFAN